MEAAAQGLVAGINAAMKVLGREPLILDRSECYIGVLIDDLGDEGEPGALPYDDLASRIPPLLRQDNADLRPTKKGYEVGPISEERSTRPFSEKRRRSKEGDQAGRAHEYRRQREGAGFFWRNTEARL